MHAVSRKWLPISFNEFVCRTFIKTALLLLWIISWTSCLNLLIELTSICSRNCEGKTVVLLTYRGWESSKYLVTRTHYFTQLCPPGLRYVDEDLLAGLCWRGKVHRRKSKLALASGPQNRYTLRSQHCDFSPPSPSLLNTLMFSKYFPWSSWLLSSVIWSSITVAYQIICENTRTTPSTYSWRLVWWVNAPLPGALPYLPDQPCPPPQSLVCAQVY